MTMIIAANIIAIPLLGIYFELKKLNKKYSME
jgi:hypothetical protein